MPIYTREGGVEVPLYDGVLVFYGEQMFLPVEHRATYRLFKNGPTLKAVVVRAKKDTDGTFGPGFVYSSLSVGLHWFLVGPQVKRWV